ncbi:membrane protein [Clostridia bacterium]|nr:membrane protein [Clostridia bacterium]
MSILLLNLVSESSAPITGGILAGIVLLVICMLALWKKVPQDKGLVVTGLRKRVISGGGGLVIPILERTDRISLENMKIEVKTVEALTEQGVGIIADGVAVIKIKSDKESILAAVEQFNTGNEVKTIGVIADIAKDVLEGKLREIISKLTVEEIYKDREKFSSQVQEVAALGLAEMGLEIKAFTIRDISDSNGYLQSLGKKRISEVKRDAQIAEAEAARETKIKTAEANRLGEEARLLAETQISQATKEKELKVQEYRKAQETARAISDLAYEIETNKVKKEVIETSMQAEILKSEKEIELKNAQMQVEITQKERETDLAKQEVIRKEQELNGTIKKIADADYYKQQKQAEGEKYKKIQEAEAKAQLIKLEAEANSQAVKLEGEAKAAIVKLEGEAQASVVRANGEAQASLIRDCGDAEAEAMTKKAEAFKQYNDAAMAEMIISKLPEIASAISAPLSKTDTITIVDSGGNSGGASKITGYVTDIIATLPATVNALTGIDLVETLTRGAKPQ